MNGRAPPRAGSARRPGSRCSVRSPRDVRVATGDARAGDRRVVGSRDAADRLLDRRPHQTPRTGARRRGSRDRNSQRWYSRAQCDAGQMLDRPLVRRRRSPRPGTPSPGRSRRAGGRRRNPRAGVGQPSLRQPRAPASRARAAERRRRGPGAGRSSIGGGCGAETAQSADTSRGCSTAVAHADVPAPAVPDDDRVAGAERLDHPGDVLRQGDRVVAVGGLVGAAVAAQVHRDGAVAGPGQCRELVAPGPPELGEAVQQQHRAAVCRARLGDMEPGPVRSDVSVRPGARYLDEVGRAASRGAVSHA